MAKRKQITGYHETKKADGSCKHPPVRVFAWFAWNCRTNQKDLFCAACCACGEVLAGGAA